MDWDRRGFTLVELMMVVAVIGVLASVAAFNALEILPRHQLHSAARDFAGYLRMARKKAIFETRASEVVFDMDGNTYSVDGRRVPYRGALDDHYGGGVRFGFGSATKSASSTAAKLPSSPITFQGSPRRVNFNQRGLSNAGTVYFANRRGECCAVVVSTSGRIRLRTWTGTKWR